MVAVSNNKYEITKLVIGFIWSLPVLLILLSIYGCGSGFKQIKMSPEEWSHLKNQPVIQAIHYPSPSLTVITPGKAMLNGLGPALVGVNAGMGATLLELGGAALLGVGAAIYGEHRAVSSGNRIVKDYSIDDPIVRVKERFLFTLEKEYNFENIRSIKEPYSSAKLAELKMIFREGLVIDFKTTRIGLNYYPSSWSHYHIDYQVRARLIRLEDSKILWQGVCRFVEKDPKTSPTMDELTADNGALLKTKLDEAADSCGKELVTQFLGK